MTYVERALMLVLESPVLESGDVVFVKDLAWRISLDPINVVYDVNLALKAQVELEAALVYLVNKYKGHKARAEAAKDYRWSLTAKLFKPRSAERPLDGEYQELLNRHVEYGNLVGLLSDLAGIVYSRRDKLEQLSVNYRREAADHE